MNAQSTLTQRILELFSGPLKGVRFPDLDAETLARASSDLDEAKVAVAAAEASLEAARRALMDHEDALERVAQRALAYARVYAVERPELRAAIDAASEPVKRGPGRPRKPREAKFASDAPAEAAAE